MPSESSPRQSRRTVAEVPPHEIPWWWQALACLVFAVVSTIVCNESAVQHRRPVEHLADTERIDINFSSQEQLESLPGIGPVLARAIITARPFASAEELARVRGVGRKLLEKLRPLIQAAPGRRTADTW